MKAAKIILPVLVLAFIAIQFIPSGMPEDKPDNEKSILHSGIANEAILKQLRKSCFDCHSDQTVFPWYSKVAPTSWFLAGHIKDAKEKLNFSEWETYSKRKKVGALGKIKDEVESGDMPLRSYLLIHRDAKLNAEKVSLISKWADEASAGFLK